MNKKPHILIIGQGISGTMLSWYVQQAGMNFTIIDEAKHNSASHVAAGLINPVTGRRIVKTWMIEALMPFAAQAYKELGAALDMPLIKACPIIDFFPTQQMRQAFTDRLQEGAEYLQINETEKFPAINHHLGYGNIAPAYVVKIGKAIDAWRLKMIAEKKLLAERFNEDALDVTDQELVYKDIKASHIIYANGYQTEQSKFWKNLPFAPNKGEALLIKCNALPQTYTYKKGVSLIPQGDNMFWVGANYIWQYNDEAPTQAFATNTQQQLKELLQVDFEVLSHVAGVRPANVERRPFVGFHPLHKNIGILSGMGAKGTSLAPWFAQELVQHIVGKKPITAEANVSRFAKVLSRI